MSNVVIVSSDNHWGLPIGDYTEYLESRHRDDLACYIEQRPSRAAGRSAGAFEYDDERKTFSSSSKGEPRLALLERDGIVGEVTFPDVIADNEIPFSAVFGGLAASWSAELQEAGRRAFNRWLSEAVVPSRQAGIAVLTSYFDLDAAARDVVVARDAGLKGVLMSVIDPADPDVPPLWDEAWDVVWSAMEDTGLGLHFHAGGTNRPVTASRPAPGPFVGAIEGYFFMHRPLWQLIGTGVLERHPRLKVVFTEQGGSWAARVLAQMDHSWEVGLGHERDFLPMRPSDYWHRQCWLGASLMTRSEIAARYDVGVDHMMYGTDHAHQNSVWNDRTNFLQWTFGVEDVPEAEARKILGTTAADFYELDLDELERAAQRVGPTVHELLVKNPEEPRPTPPGFGNADVDRVFSY